MRDIYYKFYNYTLNEKSKFKYYDNDEMIDNFYLYSGKNKLEMFELLFKHYKNWNNSHIIIAFPDSKRKKYLVYQNNYIDIVSRKKYNFEIYNF